VDAEFVARHEPENLDEVPADNTSALLVANDGQVIVGAAVSVQGAVQVTTTSQKQETVVQEEVETRVLQSIPLVQLSEVAETSDHRLSLPDAPPMLVVEVELARAMLDAHIHRVIVVDELQRPIGIVSTTDILAAVANRDLPA
jgi:CBS domain-containing protein